MRRFPSTLAIALFLLSAGSLQTPRETDKDDCEECVIVMAPTHPLPQDPAQDRGTAATVLARTLWGLFAVARPRTCKTSSLPAPNGPEPA